MVLIDIHGIAPHPDMVNYTLLVISHNISLEAVGDGSLV